MNQFWLCENVPHGKTTEQQTKSHKEARICGRVDSNSCEHWRGEQHGEYHLYQADQGESDPKGCVAF